MLFAEIQACKQCRCRMPFLSLYIGVPLRVGDSHCQPLYAEEGQLRYRTERSLEQIQLSVPGDGKYHCVIFRPGRTKYTTGAIFHPWGRKMIIIYNVLRSLARAVGVRASVYTRHYGGVADVRRAGCAVLHRKVRAAGSDVEQRPPSEHPRLRHHQHHSAGGRCARGTSACCGARTRLLHQSTALHTASEQCPSFNRPVMRRAAVAQWSRRWTLTRQTWARVPFPADMTHRWRQEGHPAGNASVHLMLGGWGGNRGPGGK